jgi:hypothetical protein
MENETRIFLFFLIAWSFWLQMILTLSTSCYNTLERWSSFGIYLFCIILYCGVRFGNYYKENKENKEDKERELLYKYNTNTYGLLDSDIYSNKYTFQ